MTAFEQYCVNLPMIAPLIAWFRSSGMDFRHLDSWWFRVPVAAAMAVQWWYMIRFAVWLFGG